MRYKLLEYNFITGSTCPVYDNHDMSGIFERI